MAISLIFTAFGRAVAQMGDPRFRRVLLIGIVLALVLLIGAVAGFAWLIEWATPDEVWLPILGEVRWVNDLASWAGVFVLAALSMFLMVPVASAITSMFLDDVADAVEARYYPSLPPTTRVPFGDALGDTLSFLGLLVVANLLALILALFLAPLAVFIFWGVNGFLLGREYFTMAAMRRIGRKRAKALRVKHRGTIWAAGILMAMPLSVPFVNLVIPVLGAATFTHLFHFLHDPAARTSVQYPPR